MSKYKETILKSKQLDYSGNYKLADQIDSSLIKLAFESLKPISIINDYYEEIGKQKIESGFGRNSIRKSFIDWCNRNNYNYDDMTKRPVLKYLFEDQLWFKKLPAFTDKDRGFIPKPPKQQQPFKIITTQNPEERKKLFIDRFLDTAQLIAKQLNYKIPISVILGIMAFESGWATSNVAKTGNVFGLTGLEPLKQLTEYDVMAQFPLFLTGKKRYHDSQIFTLGRKYREKLNKQNLSQEQKEELIRKYIQRLKDAGYNSEPIPYVENVMRIIKENNFTQYDV